MQRAHILNRGVSGSRWLPQFMQAGVIICKHACASASPEPCVAGCCYPAAAARAPAVLLLHQCSQLLQLWLAVLLHCSTAALLYCCIGTASCCSFGWLYCCTAQLLLLTQCAISAPTTEHIQMTSVAKAGLPGRKALPMANTSTARAAPRQIHVM